MDLSGYFSKVICISLKRRQDRRDELQKTLQECNWPFKQPEFFDAIDGNDLDIKIEDLNKRGWWNTSKGWYANVLSHLAVAKQSLLAINDRPVLVLEDDAIFNYDFAEEIQKFLEEVPNDWDGLMIGGFESTIEPISQRVGFCRHSWGVHCYSIHSKILGEYCEKLARLEMNTDWVTSDLMKKYKIYCPIPFLSGQRAGFSDAASRVLDYTQNGKHDFCPKTRPQSNP